MFGRPWFLDFVNGAHRQAGLAEYVNFIEGKEERQQQ